MTQPRVDAFLRVVPHVHERNFWRSAQHHALATSHDWWHLWFTCTNCLLALRYLRNASGELAEGPSHKFWCVVLLTAVTAQTAWRLLAPALYTRWRFHVLLFNR
jgi:hypothetical protein